MFKFQFRPILRVQNKNFADSSIPKMSKYWFWILTILKYYFLTYLHHLEQSSYGSPSIKVVEETYVQSREKHVTFASELVSQQKPEIKIMFVWKNCLDLCHCMIILTVLCQIKTKLSVLVNTFCKFEPILDQKRVQVSVFPGNFHHLW